MLDITGAGTQHPIRSHWMLRPSPQSYKNSKQQSKRYRANTITANSKTSTTKQTAQQPQPAPPVPPPQLRPRGASRIQEQDYWGHGRRGSICPSSHIPSSPVLLVSASKQAYVASVAPCRLAARKAVRRAACAGPVGFGRRRLRRASDGEMAAALTVPNVPPAVATLSSASSSSPEVLFRVCPRDVSSVV